MANPTYISNLSRPRLSQRRFGFNRFHTANSNPIVILPSPRSDILLLPESMLLEFTPAASAFSGTIVLSLSYRGGAGPLTTFVDLTVPTLIQYSYPLVEFGTGAPSDLSGQEGRDVILTAAADRTGGKGASLLVTTIYRIKVLGG